MYISKILAQKSSSFGLSVSGYTKFLMDEAEKRLKKEAQNRIYYLPLDSFYKSKATIEEIAPNKTLEIVENSNYSRKYSVSEENNDEAKPVEFSILGSDPCFAKLACKLKELFNKGII